MTVPASKYHFTCTKGGALKSKEEITRAEELERLRLYSALGDQKVLRVVRGRARGMIRREWLPIVEGWYAQSPNAWQGLFRKVLREVHVVDVVGGKGKAGGLDAPSYVALSSAGQIRNPGGKASNLPQEHAGELRRARLIFKLYFAPILRVAFHERAFLWALQHGKASEQTCRTVFGGISAHSSRAFSNYTHSYSEKPDGGSVVITLPPPTRTRRIIPTTTTQFTAATIEPLRPPPPLGRTHHFTTSHTSKQSSPPVWRYLACDRPSDWNTTAREMFTGRSLPMDDNTSGIKGTTEWFFVTPDQPTAEGRVTATFGGCVPRSLSRNMDLTRGTSVL